MPSGVHVLGSLHLQAPPPLLNNLDNPDITDDTRNISLQISNNNVTPINYRLFVTEQRNSFYVSKFITEKHHCYISFIIECVPLLLTLTVYFTNSFYFIRIRFYCLLYSSLSKNKISVSQNYSTYGSARPFCLLKPKLSIPLAHNFKINTARLKKFIILIS